MSGTKHKVTNSRDEYFDMVIAAIERMRNDEAMSHLFIVGVYGNDEQNENDGRAGVQFIHNLGDTVEAATLCNNITAELALRALDIDRNSTRN